MEMDPLWPSEAVEVKGAKEKDPLGPRQAGEDTASGKRIPRDRGRQDPGMVMTWPVSANLGAMACLLEAVKLPYGGKYYHCVISGYEVE
jgi:hypothetical protein